MSRIVRLGLLPLWLVALTSVSARGQLRVAEWNVSSYTSGRVNEFQTAIYASFQGRSMTPDILIAQEFINATSVTNFLNILNTAPGSPGDWAAAPFNDGIDTDNAFFYRTSKATLLATTIIAVGSTSTALQPRDTTRYDVRLAGYTSPGATLACYSTHMKAQGGTNSSGRRLAEAQKVRDNAEGQNTNGPGTGMPAGYRFLLAGDYNITSSSEPAWIELTGSQTNNDGRFFDPINTPGNWNNNSAFRFVHTQDPADATGGMDDRFDVILVSGTLVDGAGFDYIGNPAIAYSTTTWDDANHSYRAWGNDGTSFNTSLTIAGNTMVGQTIAQALVSSAVGNGHLPVFLDLRVPAKVDAPAGIDFGTVPISSLAQQSLTVTNVGDVALWTSAGIANLNYTFSPSAGFGAPGGSFSEGPGGGGNSHTLTMDTSTAGPKSGTLTIASDDPDVPNFVVQLSGVVAAPCVACDCDCNSQVNLSDLDPFVNLLIGVQPPCDACAGDGNGDLVVNAADIPAMAACLLAP